MTNKQITTIEEFIEVYPVFAERYYKYEKYYNNILKPNLKNICKVLSIIQEPSFDDIQHIIVAFECYIIEDNFDYLFDDFQSQQYIRINGRGFYYFLNGYRITLQKDLLESKVDKSLNQHYTALTIQPIEYIMANNLGFCEGNVIKYISRYKEKGGLDDLYKAKTYIEYLIKELEAKE